MESERPMDRLVCGDVGFGKTEVALRAAVKAASDGKQVMVLVPTTILAQQHFGTFRERLADLPFRVEGVSRLRPPAEVKAVLEGLRGGQGRRPDRHPPAALARRPRQGPRPGRRRRGAALRGQAEGAAAPAEAEGRRAGALGDADPAHPADEPRRPARHLGDRDPARGPPPGPHLRRPLRRGPGRARRSSARSSAAARPSSSTTGSTRCRRRPSGCAALVPKAPLRSKPTARWTSTQLEETMLGFLRGDADCLVTTTIIESGLDIPTANTLIVERADQLGLSQAYQIRGRVGRSRERAFAYLLYPSAEALTEEAAARLSTLADHTELGSGFRIAMRDLDIRGAGNLLGDEQSGHVAAVGFELYCQMIDEAVAEAARARRGSARRRRSRSASTSRSTPTCRPTFVPFEAAKIDVHRRIVAAREPGELRAIRDELERPLRAAAAAGREPAGAAAGADRAGPGRRPQRRVPRRPAQRHRGRARLRGGRGARPSRSRGRSTSGASRPPRCGSPASRRSAWRRCWRWPTGLREARRRGRGGRRLSAARFSPR